MLQIKETENELTITALPLTVWAMVIGAFIFGLYIFNIYIEGIGGISRIGKLLQGNAIGLTTVGFSLACFIGGLCFFHFIPLTITKFNRQKEIVTQTKYTLFGKRTRNIGYSYLQSKVQLFSDSIDQTTHYWLFFYVQGGEKIYLSGHSFWSKESNLELADKANEYLKAKT